jgi:acetyltransferase-like isoleucine patch superfamily enzyme
MSRQLPWDWYDGEVPANVILDEGSYLETSFSLTMFRSESACGLRMRDGSSAYTGTMFDVGPRGSVTVGRYALLNSVRIVCDAAVEIGDHALISWNVVLMDTYREPFDREQRRCYREEVAHGYAREPGSVPLPRFTAAAHPIRIGPNVWIGFDSCILPGVSIGEGSIVGARSVVTQSVPSFSVVAGNPARVVRALENPHANTPAL